MSRHRGLSEYSAFTFFNTVPVLALVELIPSLLTSPETVECSRNVEGSIGEHPILCRERAGFVVNSLLVPCILSAIRAFESGFASSEDIDRGLVRGAAHAMGPLALADLFGLDTTNAIAYSLYDKFNDPCTRSRRCSSEW